MFSILPLVLFLAPDAHANEFNYDKHNTYRVFNWDKQSCGSTLQKISSANAQSHGKPLSQEQAEQAAQLLLNYQPNNCLCLAYVALRLESEGYSSAVSGGEKLDFAAGKKLNSEARKLALAVRDSKQKISETLHLRNEIVIFKTEGGFKNMLTPFSGPNVDGRSGQCTSAWGDPGTNPPKIYRTSTKNRKTNIISGWGEGTDWNYSGIPEPGKTRTNAFSEHYETTYHY